MKVNPEIASLKKKIREEKEISRLLKEKNKPKFAGYIFLFLFVITMAYLVDEVATNINKFMETIVGVAFFGEGFNPDTILSEMGFWGSIITVVSGAAMLLRPLADRFGRKIFLVIYTFGMAIGMGMFAISYNVSGWIVGTLLIQMCIPHDMQQVYIQECVPKEKRGTYFSIIKGLATLGLIIIPLFKIVFNVGVNTGDNWRYVYYGTAIIGLVSAILALIFIRESDVYINNRLKQLMMTEEERLLAKKEKSEEEKRGGIINGFVHLFKHKQLRWVTISMMCCMIAYVLTDHYTGIISIGYLNSIGKEITKNNYDLAENILSNALLLYPIGCAIVEFLPGIIADKIGRKKASIFFGAGALIFYVLFYLGSIYQWNNYLKGFFLGAACGAVWSYGDLLLLMISESTETNLRISCNTTCLFAAGMLYAIAKAVIEIICKSNGSDAMMGIYTIVVVVIGLTSSIIINLLKTKETKGVDLNTITAKDYE